MKFGSFVVGVAAAQLLLPSGVVASSLLRKKESVITENFRQGKIKTTSSSPDYYHLTKHIHNNDWRQYDDSIVVELKDHSTTKDRKMQEEDTTTALEVLEWGVPVDITLQDDEVFQQYVLQLPEDAGPSVISCQTAGTGDSFLQVANPELNRAYCTSRIPGPNDACYFRDRGETVFVPYLVGVANDTSVQLQCDYEPIANLMLGSDIPIVLNTNEVQFYKYEIEPNHKMFCLIEAPDEDHTVDAELVLFIPDGANTIACESFTTDSSMEVCWVVNDPARFSNATMDVYVQIMEEKDDAIITAEDGVTLKCHAGPVVGELSVESPMDIPSIPAGGLQSFSYTAPSNNAIGTQIQCTVNGGASTMGLSMRFEAKNFDARACVTGDNDVCHLGMMNNGAILNVDVFNFMDAAATDAAATLDCTMVVEESINTLEELNTPVTITLEENAATYYEFTTATEGAPVDISCIIPTPETMAGRVHLSGGMPDINVQRIIWAYAEEGEAGGLFWPGWPHDATKFVILVENYGDAANEFQLVCNTTASPVLTLGEDIPIELEDDVNVQRFPLKDDTVVLPATLNCTVTSTGGAFPESSAVSLGIFNEYGANGDGFSSVNCAARASGESVVGSFGCAAIVEDPNVVQLNVFVVANEEALQEDNALSLFCALE